MRSSFLEGGFSRGQLERRREIVIGADLRRRRGRVLVDSDSWVLKKSMEFESLLFEEVL